MLSPYPKPVVFQVPVGFVVAAIFAITHTYFRGDKAPVLMQPAVSKNDYSSLNPGDLSD